MQPPCWSVRNRTNENSASFSTTRKSLVNTYFVLPNSFFNVMKETKWQWSVGPATWIVNCAEKYFAIRPVCEHIIYHGVTTVSTVIGILGQPFVSALGGKWYAVHKANHIGHTWFTCLHHSCKLLHFLPIREFYSCMRVEAHTFHNPTQHFSDNTGACRRRDTKKQTEMLVWHRASQIK